MHFPAKNGLLFWRPPTRGRMRTVLTLLALLLPALHLLALHPLTLGQNAMEDQVKAAYLLNFAKLAEWPRHALPDGPSPLVIGVSGGDDGFLKVLMATVAGKLIGTHSLVAKPVTSEADMKSCHIVFFRASEKKHFQAAIDGLAQAGVLSVGEDESFLRQGGMINLVKEHGTVRFEVNSDALDRSEIHFSAKILALAKAGYESTQATATATATATPLPGGSTRQVERRVTPDYPELAGRMNLKGIAQVEARVRPDGTVKEVRIVGGHPLLADALVYAVKQWKYQPASKETVEVVKFSFGPQ
jgi:TonB family protein